MNLASFAVPIAGLVAAAALRAAPLTATTAVQTRPDPSAPVIGFLKAGAEPKPAAAAPAGWLAVALPGPFSAYVRDQDLNKALEVKAGSPLYLRPSLDAAVLTVAAKGDKIEITGLEGRWTEVQLNQPVIGFINVGGASAAPTSAPPATEAPPPPTNAPGHPAPDLGASAPLPRYFEGILASTRRAFAPRRPYDWELRTEGGARICYVDVSRLLLPQPIDTYAGQQVLVYGAPRAVPGTKDIVVAVDSLRLK